MVIYPLIHNPKIEGLIPIAIGAGKRKIEATKLT
jgi:hypothetical protein